MEELTKVTIHVAKTRPAMKFGLPIELLIVFMVVTVEIGTLVGFFYMIPMIAVWWGLTIWVRKDYNMPRVFFLWFRGAAWDFDASVWGGVSVDPLPPSSKEYRGIPHS
jgi:type IV secretory pathway VirB3-like protein